jgi:hypothetical protein
MLELTKLRTKIMKVFDKAPDERIYRCHIGNIHYPDTSKVFQDINTTLNAQAGGVYQDKCFYHCEVPDKADGVFGFYNRDHHFSLKLVGVNSVGYTPVPGIWGDLGKGCRYKDAFGSGIHFEAIAKNMSYEKRICFEKPPPDITKDFVFEYEIVDAPDRLEFKDSMLSATPTIIDPTKTDLTALSIENKITSIYSSTGKYKSLIHFPKCYDSNPNGKKTLPVRIMFYMSGGKVYLRKTIPKEIFKDAVYPVYADDPVRYDPPTGDGFVEYGYNASWDTTHDAVTGSSVDYAPGDFGFDTGSYFSTSDEFKIMRGFLPIDTSGIADGDTVTAAIMYVYAKAKDDYDNDGDDWINIVGATSQAATTSLITADYNQCGSVNNPTEWATRIDLGSITISAYNQFTFNATGRAAVNKTGVTLLGTREGHDCIDNAIDPTTGGGYGGVRLTVYDSSRTGTSEDPYLDVTAGAGGWTGVINGVTNPAKINGIPVANIKRVMRI